MRLRKVKDALQKLETYQGVCILNPEEHKGKWLELFANDNQLLNIEIGCGKGRFMCEMAKANPNINFIGIEKFDSVLIRALELYEEYNLPNLKFVLFDADKITDIFTENEVSNIYLNFSDPWPKTRHHKRRLTAKSFLDDYRIILKSDGKIIQKTDNRHLFAYSLESFCRNNYLISNISLDLHNEDWPNIMTEFEEKWSKKGPIYYLEATIRHE